MLLELTQIGGEQVAEVRAMVSQPGYDPNLIDAEFETLTAVDPGPLVNRAAQGLYQPGMVLQPMIAAAAIDSGSLDLDAPLSDPFLPVTLHGQVLRCAIPRTEANTTVYTWRDMAILRCPDPLRTLGMTLGGPALDEIFSRFGLHQVPSLPIPVEGNPATITDPGLAAIGQEALTITPLQAALAAATVAGDGRLPRPRLVEELAGPDGAWQTQPAGESANSQLVISPLAAEAIRQTWPVNNEIASLAVNVLAGPEDSRNAWYLGMTPVESPRYVLAVVLEEESDTNAVERIGQEILAAARDND